MVSLGTVIFHDPGACDRVLRELGPGLVDLVRQARAAGTQIVELARVTIKGMKTGEAGPEGVEARAFLEWMVADHFTFLGYRRFGLASRGKSRTFQIDQAKSLGVLTKARLMIFEGVSNGAPVPAQFADFLESRNILLILKANQRSSVQRRSHYDVVAVKVLDDSGKPVGMHMFVGLFTADVYTNSPNFVPVLRNKLERISPSWRYVHTHFGIGYRFAAEPAVLEARRGTAPTDCLRRLPAFGTRCRRNPSRPRRQTPTARRQKLPGSG